MIDTFDTDPSHKELIMMTVAIIDEEKMLAWSYTDKVSGKDFNRPSYQGQRKELSVV